jgi:hypothetical protein
VEIAAIDILPAERAIISGCPRCSQDADGGLRSFVLLLAAAVEESNQQLGVFPPSFLLPLTNKAQLKPKGYSAFEQLVSA